MDPLTHSLSGVLLSRTGFYQKWGRPATVTLVIASLFPDIDHLTLRLAGPIAYLKYHRGFTHSLIGIIPLAIILAFIIRHFFKKDEIDFPKLMLTAMLGITAHICLDLITSYGTQIFFPFSTYRYSLDLVFIVDPYFSLIFILPLILWVFKKERARAIAITAIFLALTYLVMAYIFKNIAAALAKKEAASISINASRVEAIPMPFSPFKWSVFVEDKEKFYQINVDIARGKIDTKTFDKEPEQSDIIKKTEEMEMVKVYKWFARFPVVTSRLDGDDYIIEYFDLRFNSLPPRKPFLLKVILDKEGSLKEGELFFHSIRPR